MRSAPEVCGFRPLQRLDRLHLKFHAFRLGLASVVGFARRRMSPERDAG